MSKDAIYDPPAPWPPADEEYFQVLICRQSDKASADEIRALRKICRELAELPMQAAVMEIESRQTINLGTYPSPDAKKLQAKAELSGLNVTLEPSTSDTLTEKDSFDSIPVGPCSVCGQPGIVQNLPGVPASDCFCEEHAPSFVLQPLSCLFFLLLFIALLVVLFRFVL